MDSAIAALIGAGIGSIAGIIGTVITTNHSAKLAGRQRAHEVKIRHKELILEIYETVQAGLINLTTAKAGIGRVDKDLSNPTTFAQMTLHSSEAVRKVWDDCFADLKKDGGPKRLPDLISAMRKHIEELDRDLLS